jgi:hypothetical protein
VEFKCNIITNHFLCDNTIQMEAGALARPEAEAAMTESDERDTEVLGGLPATVQTRVPVVSPVEKPKRKRRHQVSDEAAKTIARTGPKKANPKDCDCEHESLLAMKAVEWLPTSCQPGKALHGMKCFNKEC